MNNLLILIITVGLVGAASAYLGSFMVLKRMSLVGDALSHVALPGIAVALIFNLNPILVAFIALILSVVGVWYLSEHSKVYTEALVGVFFTASLALGLLLTPEPELLEALFGNVDNISLNDRFFVLAGSIIVFVVLKLISKKLILGIVSEDLAKSLRIDTSKINLVFLLLVGLVIALGIKFLGTLLTGAMVIIPAAAAKNLSGNIKQFQILSVVFGVAASVLGILLAGYFGIALGPSIVLTAVVVFVCSYLPKK